MISNHIILPIGIIKESTGAGTTIRLIPPHPDDNKLQPQMNILTRDSGTGAHARAVVRVLGIQGNSARFEILELETEPELIRWSMAAEQGCSILNRSPVP